jgi:ubiquinone/menaquinone biosynthesis C-methylase UbiE
MRVRGRIDAKIARQLGHPAGFAGRLVAKRLNRRNRRTIEGAVEALSSGPGAVIADVGFGGGIGLRLLLDRPGAATVHGVDVSSAMIEQARAGFAEDLAAGRLYIHHGSITALPLPASSLDGLITINTIYFIDDLEQAFRELARTVRASGRAVIGIGDPDAMKKMSFTDHGFRVRPIADIETVLNRAGLTLIEHRRVGEGRIPAHLLVTTPQSSDRAK